MEVRKFIARLLVCCACLLPAQVWAQSQAASVFANAQVQVTPPRITLQWLPGSNVTGYQIWRKLKGGTNWGSPVANLGAGALSWADNSVSLGVSYEYKIVRSSSNLGSGYGYVNAGIELPMVEARGKLILLVDNTFSASLAGPLEQLRQDLEADGWTVLRHDVSRYASVPSIKSIIISDYNADPQNTKMVFLVGHVPVPYSGNLAPDGHWEHQGAWSADTYYGDVDGTWTDNQAYVTYASDPRNHNVPGDGKFDQSTIPSSVELAVGRVDFSNLPVFSQNETTLLGNYLSKLHNWKVKAFTAVQRGLVDDNFQGMSDAFAANAYRGFSPLVGGENVSDLDYFTTLSQQSYLWSYGCGGGYWYSSNGVGSSTDFTTRNVKSVFTVLFGSYFGDFDCENNFMRSSLGSGTVLSCFWAGFPNWYFHHMALGETLGYAARLTQNNGSGHYAPANSGAGKVHIALLGDPTLRMAMVAPPSNVTGTVNGNSVSLSWNASPDNVIGYHVYRFVPASQTWTRVTTNAVTGTSYTEVVAGGGTIRYMVRALKLEQGKSGSYFNLSLGAYGQAQGGSQNPDCLGVPGGPATTGTPCDDGQACTTGDVWDASCQCQGTFQDTDGDGVCDALDDCPQVPGQVGTHCNDGNPCTVNDVLDANCQCVGTWLDSDGDGICNAQDNCPQVPGQIGSPCNDGDPCTTGDVVNANCQCAGTFQDTDGDGTCNALDDCPTTAGGIGSPCDDGSICTVNDIVDANCQCAGEFQDADGDGVCDAEDYCPMSYGEPGWPCNDGDPCTSNDVVDMDCQCSGTPAGDTDNDGICDALDECPNIPGNVGSPCNDGNICTVNDVVDANCGCTGTFQDSDNDGVCNAEDYCPFAYGEPGWACNDGNPCTVNDTVDMDCQCVGTYSGDTDNDGICDALDDCPTLPGGVGTACNDGDICTMGDAIDENCQCTGILLDSDGDGVCDAEDYCPQGYGEPGWACNDGNPCTVDDTVDMDCQCVGTYSGDTDGDGACDTLDECPTMPGGVGSPCNDGDPCTVLDRLNANCQCAGFFYDSDGDGVCNAEDGCPGDPNKTEPGNCGCGNPEPGAPCDDGNPNTGNDEWSVDCECVGQQVDCLGVPGGGALPGTICNDGNNTTVGDSWTTDCQCIGLVVDCEGVPGGGVLPGMPCDDMNPLTVNDKWSAECDCLGDPVDCLGVIGGTALPGTACNDGNPNTQNDLWQPDCTCSGQVVDCLGVPDGGALPGTPCDDGDASTGSDVWGADCVCAGLPYDCLNVPGGPAMPGSQCEDGNPLTGDDTWSPACICSGLLLDCEGVAGGTAFIDGCGQCAGGTTGILPNPDADMDGVLDCVDLCPQVADPVQGDFDTDGVGDACDNCPWTFNPGQEDSNSDGIGDACSTVSVRDLGKSAGASVHPNPTDGLLLIRDADLATRTVVVHDLAGGEVLHGPFSPQVDLSLLAPGTYILILRDAAGTTLARFPVVRN